MSSPTLNTASYYVAQCGTDQNGSISPGNIYYDPYNLNTNMDFENTDSACNYCNTDSSNLITTYADGTPFQTVAPGCSLLAPIPAPTQTLTNLGYNTGGGPVNQISRGPGGIIPVDNSGNESMIYTQSISTGPGGAGSLNKISTGPGGIVFNNSGNELLLYAGLGGGNASHGLNTTQIALIILLVLVLAGTGAFFLFRNAKK